MAVNKFREKAGKAKENWGKVTEKKNFGSIIYEIVILFKNILNASFIKLVFFQKYTKHFQLKVD